jgi:uncharacterized membrane protein YfcA
MGDVSDLDFRQTPGVVSVTIATLAIVGVAVLVAAFVQGTIGVGFALIVAPVISLIDPGQLPVLVLVLMIPLNLYVLMREHSALDWRGTGWITAGRVVGTFGGLAVLTLLLQWQLDLFVGVATIGAALATLAAPVFSLRPATFVSAGLVTGVTETATGIGGPPLALLYQHQSGPVLRATIAACFLIGQIISLIALLAAGRAAIGQVALAALLVPALAAGGLLSQLSHRAADGRWMRRLVLGFALASGAVLVARALS